MNSSYRFAALHIIVLVLCCTGCQQQTGGVVMGNAASATPTGPVRISTDRTVYHPADTVHVTVFNALTQPIFAWDSEASCSILMLQFLRNGQWEPSAVALCALGHSAMPVQIDAAGQYRAAIRADSGLQPAIFPVGVYRLIVRYGLHATLQPPSIAPPFSEAFSASFTIQAPS